MADWSRLHRSEQAEIKTLVNGKLAHIPAASVSQVAKHWDTVQDWTYGDITLEQLCQRAGWALPAPATKKVTARELAASLGVSISTIYRRCHSGAVQAVKNGLGRWVITVTA